MAVEAFANHLCVTLAVFRHHRFDLFLGQPVFQPDAAESSLLASSCRACFVISCPEIVIRRFSRILTTIPIPADFVYDEPFSGDPPPDPPIVPSIAYQTSLKYVRPQYRTISLSFSLMNLTRKGLLAICAVAFNASKWVEPLGRGNSPQPQDPMMCIG
jgi:hypothetical protein